MSPSSAQQCLATGHSLSCALPQKFESNGDIAGQGVFISFAVSAAFTIFTAYVLACLELRELWLGGQLSKREMKHIERARTICDSLSVGFSDAMLITTLALLIPTYWTLACEMSAYHYDLVCCLILVSNASFTGAILVAHRYFDTKKTAKGFILSVTRVILIVVTYGISGAVFARRWSSPIFPVYTPEDDQIRNTGLVLPAACFIDHPLVNDSRDLSNFTATPSWLVYQSHPQPAGPSNSTALMPRMTSIYSNFTSNDTLSPTMDTLALGFVTGALIINLGFSAWRAHIHRDGPESHLKSKKWILGVRTACVIISMVVVMYGLIRFHALQTWMSNSGWFAKDDGESSIQSFGQLMPLFLLILPTLTVFESVAE